MTFSLYNLPGESKSKTQANSRQETAHAELIAAAAHVVADDVVAVVAVVVFVN